MLRFLKYVQIAFVRTLEHDQFAVAKAAAYSAILTLFPAVLLISSILTASHSTLSFVREISFAIGGIMPSGTAPSLLTFFEGRNPAPVRMIVTTSLITLWTGSGVMISCMEGFRRAYQMPKTWNLTQERLISFLLVFMAGIPMAFASFLLAFGNQIEHWLAFHANRDLDLYILAMWTIVRWLIAVVTTIAVVALIYHHGLPRTQPWHRVVPGSVLATGLWFASTTIFGWYLRHYADYGVIYGSVGTAIALLIWLYLVSLVILIGAEFNALRYPRYLFGSYSKLEPDAASPRTESKENMTENLKSLLAEENRLEPVCRRRAKIVCTLGPVLEYRGSDSPVNAAWNGCSPPEFLPWQPRPNTSGAFALCASVAVELGRTVCVLQDLQGPKIRTSALRDHMPVNLASRLRASPSPTRRSKAPPNVLGTTFKTLAREVEAGSRILLSDGQSLAQGSQGHRATTCCAR